MSKSLTGNEVRQLFLDYFLSKDHMIEPGASLIPKDDPTLLWINAGVAPLKKYFDGSEKPKKNRIANVQKSIRTNDIENVGKTARHHTFFEMLGNFSIGDYFKPEAIPFAWEFLTGEDWLGIDKDKLYVSVYSDDQDAYRIWTEVCKVDPSHILKTDDNFWEIGKGPGGPDTEIFYDRGEKYDPEGIGEDLFFKEMENDRYVEVWNVVFSQYDCNPEIDRKDYQELPQKNIDTGMGLERLVALLQDAETNFDTDLFEPILKKTMEMAVNPYEGEYKMAYRVIADHIRTLVFALSDGAAFSNSGRGYVLRRLLRRAVRFGMRLGIEKEFMAELVDSVIEAMGSYYPDLEKNKEKIKKLIEKEERSFKKTLKNGYELLDSEVENSKDGKLSGEVAFRLYDTYGFPFELTEEICQEKGIEVDREGFEQEMQQQKQRARNARQVENSFGEQNEDLMNFVEESRFIGYEQREANGVILAMFENGKLTDHLEDEGQMILDPTIFYATSGGQISDLGSISTDDAVGLVKGVTKSRNGQHLIDVEVISGVFETGQEVLQSLDIERRNKITANHSATHLLQSALKQVLGNEIMQQGSFVGPDYLRFDFNYADKLSPQELDTVEKLVNEMIAQAHPVTKEVMPIEQARQKGAIALFNEKYGNEVRVVSMGDVSMEFCGGTHVDNTNEIGLCKIVSQESIGANTRRITAKTGLAAYEDFLQEQHMLENIAAFSKAKGIKDLDQKVKADYEQLHQLQKQNQQLLQKLTSLEVQSWLNDIQQVNGLEVLVQSVKSSQSRAIKDELIHLCKQKSQLACIVFVQDDKSVQVIAACGKEAIDRGVQAGSLLKELFAHCSGKGGGKKESAQGRLANPAELSQAVSFSRTLLDKLAQNG